MKYVRRFLWFTASRLLIFSLIVSVLILGFYVSMYGANIYILLSDGMAARTHTILTREDAEDLINYFRADTLESDETLAVALSSDSPYIYYNITDYECHVGLEWVWCWPWEDTAQAVISYRVTDIHGSVVAGKQQLVRQGQLTASPPDWVNSGRYSVTLYRVDGRWKIAGLIQTQVFSEPTPIPAAGAPV
ncbi:MAG: hypothetical protein IKE30_00405 [Clostridia bacterium]|nr:hypothetical protein [Clostridia bacterium]